MESYVNTVRKELSQSKKTNKIKLPIEKYDSEEAFSDKPLFKTNTPVKPATKKHVKKKHKDDLLFSPSKSELDEPCGIKRKHQCDVMFNTWTEPDKRVNGSPNKPKKKAGKHKKKQDNTSIKPIVSPKPLRKKLTNGFHDKKLEEKIPTAIKPEVLPLDPIPSPNDTKNMYISEESNDFDFDNFVENHTLEENNSEESQEEWDSMLHMDNVEIRNNVDKANGFPEEQSSQFIEESKADEEIVNEQLPPEYYTFDHKNGKTLVLPPGKSVEVHGYMVVKVLKGELYIFGQSLQEGTEIDLFSPRGSALFTLKNNRCTPLNKTDLLNLKDLVTNCNHTNFEDVNIPENVLVLLCTQIKRPSIDFLEENISQQIFPRSNDFPVDFVNDNDLPVVKISPEWDKSLSPLTRNSKLMIVGGKGVGKSTCLRYSINKLLETNRKVRVVDLDPGQSEFTVPGCISIVTVDKPVYSPNYLHLRKPERSILSNINVGNEPGKYIQAIEILMGYYNQLDALPTVINYMGFTNGIGINLVAATIAIVKPTHILQISSSKKKNNFSCLLNAENVFKNLYLFYKKTPPTFEYELASINSMTDGKLGWSLEPRQMREMCIISYFGQMMDDKTDTITSFNVPMFQVPLSDINITDLSGNPVRPAAANANLVSLCSLDDRSFICHGWGIVRGIDISNNVLVLITPEKQQVLEDVNYLVVGCLNLPPSLYMNTKGLTGSIPYIMEGELDSLSQFTKRVYIPPNKK